MVYEVVDVAIHGPRYTAARILDTVVGDAVLGEVVSADFFGAVASADQAAALGREFGILFVDFGLEQP